MTRRWRVWLVASIILPAMVLVLCGSGFVSWLQYRTAQITEESFEKLAVGMREDEVTAVLGAPNEALLDSKLKEVVGDGVAKWCVWVGDGDRVVAGFDRNNRGCLIHLRKISRISLWTRVLNKLGF